MKIYLLPYYRYFSKMNASTEYPSTTESNQAAPYAYIITHIMLFGIAAIVGLVGNSLVIAATILYKPLRSVHNVFIVNLAVADIIFNMIIQPSVIFAAIDEGVFLIQHNALCVVLGSLALILGITSIISITMIAIERYLFICLNKYHHKIYNRYTIPLMIIGIWLYAVVVDLPNHSFIGWGQHAFAREIYACYNSYAKALESGFHWYMSVLGFAIPVSASVFSYIQIYRYVRKTRKNISSRSATALKPVDRQILKYVAIIFITFFGMWFPFILILNLSYFTQVPHWLTLVVSLLSGSNCSINFMIYALHKNFRDGYALVLAKMGFKRCCFK